MAEIAKVEASRGQCRGGQTIGQLVIYGTFFTLMGYKEPTFLD